MARLGSALRIILWLAVGLLALGALVISFWLGTFYFGPVGLVFFMPVLLVVYGIIGFWIFRRR
jgi:hypothetical protein